MSVRQRVFAHKCLVVGSVLLGLAFIGTGIQHFIYLKFVATLVPKYIPVPILWAGLTGAAMIVAGVSFILKRKVTLTATFLSLMMLGFIAMIHIPGLIANAHHLNNWIRLMQDLAILGTAMLLTSIRLFKKPGVLLYAVPLLLLGLAHFIHPGLITPKIPTFLHSGSVFDYVFGGVMAGLSICVIAKRFMQMAALALGVLLLVFALFYSGAILFNNINNGAEWTNFLLAVAVAAGGFVVAGKVGK